MQNAQLDIFNDTPFNLAFKQLKQDLGNADAEAIQDMLLLTKTKMILMKKRGIHDVLSGRILKLAKEHENIKLNFLNKLADEKNNSSLKINFVVCNNRSIFV